MAETTTMKVVTFSALQNYHSQITNYIDAADARSIKTVAIDGNVLKFYRVDEPVGTTEPAYQIELPETDISNLLEKLEGATAGNVVVANADGTVADGGVALADLATKAEVKTVDDKVTANTEAIEAINNADTGILKQAKDYADSKDEAISGAQSTADEAKGAAEKAQGDVDALAERVTTVEGEVGELADLETTNKGDLVTAINEVRNAVQAGGVDSAITIDTTTTTEGYLKSYTIKQGENTVGTIDIPKDLVVESGSVVTLADGEVEGQAAGTYIKLVLANSGDVLYVNVGTLVDIYKAQESAAQVQISIDSATREISASIVAGGVGTTELADNAVTTVKIADGNVTKAKLATDAISYIDGVGTTARDEAKAYADELDGAMDARVKAVEEAVGTDGSVADLIANAKQEAIETAAGDATEKANQALEDAKTYTNEEVAKDRARLEALEADTHTHDNAEVLNGITAEKVSTWDSALHKADITTGTENGTIAVEGTDVAVKGLGSAAYTDSTAYDASGSAATAKTEAMEYADGLNTSMDERVAVLESVKYVEVTDEEINSLFATTEA